MLGIPGERTTALTPLHRGLSPICPIYLHENMAGRRISMAPSTSEIIVRASELRNARGNTNDELPPYSAAPKTSTFRRNPNSYRPPLERRETMPNIAVAQQPQVNRCSSCSDNPPLIVPENVERIPKSIVELEKRFCSRLDEIATPAALAADRFSPASFSTRWSSSSNTLPSRSPYHRSYNTSPWYMRNSINAGFYPEIYKKKDGCWKRMRPWCAFVLALIALLGTTVAITASVLLVAVQRHVLPPAIECRSTIYQGEMMLSYTDHNILTPLCGESNKTFSDGSLLSYFNRFEKLIDFSFQNSSYADAFGFSRIEETRCVKNETLQLINFSLHWKRFDHMPDSERATAILLDGFREASEEDRGFSPLPKSVVLQGFK